MTQPKTLKRIQIGQPSNQLWIDIIEIKRGTRILGKSAYLCQGDDENPTEYYVSKYNIQEIIDALEEAKLEICQ